MESPELPAPQEETAKRFAQVRRLFVALLKTWKTTALAIALGVICYEERFWEDPVMRFTCPMILLLLSLPVLSAYDFSFVKFVQKQRKQPHGPNG